MLSFLTIAAMAAAQAPMPADEPIWQMPNGEIMFRDYPDQARAQGRTGKTAFRMVTSAEGVPTACEVTKSSGHVDLDRETCRSLMMYAKFKPIRIKNGVQVVKGVVKWSPAEAAAALAAMRAGPTVVFASAAAPAAGPKALPTPRWAWNRSPKQQMRNFNNEKLVCKRLPRTDSLSGHEYRCRAAEAWTKAEQADGFWGELQGRQGWGTGVR